MSRKSLFFIGRLLCVSLAVVASVARVWDEATFWTAMAIYGLMCERGEANA